ncbi:hypothetical protein D3C77_627930 [compost metagenome]
MPFKVRVTVRPASAIGAVPETLCATSTSVAFSTSSPAIRPTVRVGAVASTVTVVFSVLLLPAVSVTVTVKAGVPSGSACRSAEGTLTLQLPLPSTVPV